ncbi:MAG: T9SS type A sorting domain-containing protein [Deferribacteres bacterium]|nr:T9SS type A sorting domain-containing protein [candidate division KSB1 bacterium]MCB9502489.1 T9SS type A sorting domain-containing protein [Deferribacteres bacterium]
MKKILLTAVVFVFTSSIYAQNPWNFSWKMDQQPFTPPAAGSEMGIVKAGFDTDEDGWGEFVCAYTDKDSNYVLMYEATADNSFELVWYWRYPVPANTFAGIVVGDMDNNGVVEIITTMPSVVSSENPNPSRLWVFEWNGVQGENKYGVYNGDEFTPTSEWNFNLEDNIDFRPYSLTVEDIDLDGTNELIVGVRQGDRGREVLVADVIGEFSSLGAWNVEYDLPALSGGALYNVTTGDLDNDGNREILVAIWNLFSLMIIECTGPNTYEVQVEHNALFSASGIDHGALDAVRVADANGDGINELYYASMESENMLFMITNINDVSTIDTTDIVKFFSIPGKEGTDNRLRTLYIDDPDGDGNIDLMIGGERSGQVYDLEYKGAGDPSDSTSWELTIAFDLFDYTGFAPLDSVTIGPRVFYGHPAGDMDQDGLNEYVFVNYSADLDVTDKDGYVWVIEADEETGVAAHDVEIPQSSKLLQNYPNPFNPETTIEFALDQQKHVTIKVYNSLGQFVSTLLDNEITAGSHKIKFDAADLPTGNYFVQLVTKNKRGMTDFMQTRKITLLK